MNGSWHEVETGKVGWGDLKMRNVLVVLLFGFAYMASAMTVSIDTQSAKAVLAALANPELTHEEALKVAAMPGNQGIIRKSKEFKIPATNENFADALYDAAHGVKAKDKTEESYFFDHVKEISPQLTTLVGQMESDPAGFQQAIEKRIALYSPAGMDVHLQGYVVAGGDGGGYAFSGTDFYLNIGWVNELILARSVTTHELYHAVQGAFSKDRGAHDELPSLDGMSHAQQVCAKEHQLFGNLYEEGSAVEVADVSLLNQAHSEIANRQRTDLTDGVRHVRTSARLLEMSVLSFEAPDAMAFDDVYDVDFLGHGVLYNVGYVMAKAITDAQGPQGLAAYLKLPPEQFVLGYLKLPLYGKDEAHPLLLPNTIAAVKRVASGCE